MVQEAESHAEEDRKRREAIGLINDAESMTYQADNVLKEHGDKIAPEIKAELDQKLQEVKEILDKDRENVDRLKPAYEEMVAALSKVGSAMYQQAGTPGETGEPDFGANGAGGQGAEDESTVEGEFREVGSDR
jgi:molecular chaperone DnaK